MHCFREIKKNIYLLLRNDSKKILAPRSPHPHCLHNNKVTAATPNQTHTCTCTGIGAMHITHKNKLHSQDQEDGRVLQGGERKYIQHTHKSLYLYPDYRLSTNIECSIVISVVCSSIR